MRTAFLVALWAAPVIAGLAGAARAERTDVDVRVLARGAKFLGGYDASVAVVLTDADTGQVLARGMTSGGTGDTARIMAAAGPGERVSSSEGSAVFRASLELDRPRRVTASVTGPLSQPQATAVAASTRWVLPGRHLTAGDGWRLELAGLIVDLASPMAYQQVKAGTTLPVRASVTLLCGCAISTAGPWRAGDTEVDGYLSVDGGPPRHYPLVFDPASGIFAADLAVAAPGLYELDVRAWREAEGNAGVARAAFFVH